MTRKLFILLLAAGLTGCDLIPQPFSGRKALNEVEDFVDISPRDSGTSGAKRAAYYISSRLSELGYNAAVDPFLAYSPKGEIPFFNVTAELKGRSDEWIVIGSHFDTKSGIDGFQGANDSGSSTGLLIELARALRHQKPECSILFAFFDGEECMVKYGPQDGLQGSRQLARQLSANGRKVAGVIILDMIGDKRLSLTIPSNSDYALLGHFFDAAQELGCRDKIMMYGDVLDDHVPFLQAGYPAIDLMDFQYGSGMGANDYWHTSKDTVDKLSADSLQLVGDLVLNMIGRIKPEQQ